MSGAEPAADRGADTTADSGDQSPRDPDEIRRDIEQTREELGETVAAVAEKADVKAQAKAKVDDVKAQANAKVDDVKERVTGKKDEFAQKAKDATPEGGGDAAAKAQTFAQENKTALIIAGAIVGGILIGRITSRS